MGKVEEVRARFPLSFDPTIYSPVSCLVPADLGDTRHFLPGFSSFYAFPSTLVSRSESVGLSVGILSGWSGILSNGAGSSLGADYVFLYGERHELTRI